jgi:HEAT repeat protein
MPIRLRLSLMWLALAVTALHAGTDKLQESVAALASKDTSTYNKAVDYLSKHSVQAEPFLLTMFHNSSDPLARLRAVKLLGDFGDKAAIGDMQQVLYSGSESNTAVRIEIIRSLAKVGSSSSLIEYLNKRKADEPSVSAAIAVGLQGNTDEGSKTALGGLLQTDDTRVSRAALMAVSKTYETTLAHPQGNTSIPKNGEHPHLTGTAAGEKLNPTPGDQAIFEALKAKGASNDPHIKQEASELLGELTERYKQQ